MSNYEYFELKYLEEINQLFLDCKKITEFNGLYLFHHRKDNFMDIFDFIVNNIELINETDEEDYKDTFNEDENYSML